MCASVYVVEDREIFRHVIIILDIKNCAALGNFDIFIRFFPRYVSSLQQKAFTTVSFRRPILNFTHKRIIELKQRQQPTELGHAICSFSSSHPLLLLCVWGATEFSFLPTPSSRQKLNYPFLVKFESFASAASKTYSIRCYCCWKIHFWQTSLGPAAVEKQQQQRKAFEFHSKCN